MPAEDMKSRIDDMVKTVKQKYEPRIEALKQKGAQMQDDFKKPSAVGVVVGADVDIKWKDHAIVFDIPSVTMKDEKMSFDLPEVTMDLVTLSWDMPSVCMVLKEIGPIKLHLPEPCMKRQEVKLHLPQVTMKRQEIIMGIPQFTMERTRWVLALPEFTLRNVKADISEMESKGAGLKAEGEALAKEMQTEIQTGISGVFGGGAAGNSLVVTYDQALVKLKEAIDSAVAAGLDPIKIQTDKGVQNLRKEYATILEQRDALVAKLAGGGALNAEGQALVRFESVDSPAVLPGAAPVVSRALATAK